MQVPGHPKRRIKDIHLENQLSSEIWARQRTGLDRRVKKRGQHRCPQVSQQGWTFEVPTTRGFMYFFIRLTSFA